MINWAAWSVKFLSTTLTVVNRCQIASFGELPTTPAVVNGVSNGTHKALFTRQSSFSLSRCSALAFDAHPIPGFGGLNDGGGGPDDGESR